MTLRLIAEAEHSIGSQKVPLRLYENDASNPEIYIDGLHGLAASEMIIKLNFYSAGLTQHLTLEHGEDRVVAARLVMGVDTFLGVVDTLMQARNEIISQRERAAQR